MAPRARPQFPSWEGLPIHSPGSDQYRQSSSPQNSFVDQEPALVATPADIDELASCVRYAVRCGLNVVPQATGHGAALPIGDGVMLIDTSLLNRIDIDVERRLAVVGAGNRWRTVNAEAFAHGLLGRAGSSPDVGVAGYTFGAGAGWLTRPHGLAGGSLTAVDFVDGDGDIHRATDDADRQVDRDAMWAYRGGGGVGIAASLEFGLVAVSELWAGYFLWPIDALAEVVTAWAPAIDQVGGSLSTSISVLIAPPIPEIPSGMHGQPTVHLALASTDGPGDAKVLLDGLRAAQSPIVSTWGPSDLDRLQLIHLDPPSTAPAVGVARWLTGAAPTIALDVLRAALEGPVQMIELRNVGNDAPALVGAMTRPPGDFMLHAVGGPAPTDGGIQQLEATFEAILSAAELADTGLAVGSWSDSRPAIPDALPADIRRRAMSIADQLDPQHVIIRPPVLSDMNPVTTRP